LGAALAFGAALVDDDNNAVALELEAELAGACR